MIDEKDFSRLKRFPGETGNLFDVVLHKLQAIQRIPAPLFAVLLFSWAVLAARLQINTALPLFGFFMLDWLIIGLLPIARWSFGPPQPSVFLLAILRALFAFTLPLPVNWFAQVIGTLIVIDAFWIEPHHLQVTRQSLSTRKLPAAAHLKVLHLGDLHIERITRREKRLQVLIQQLQPDLILFSGDILNLSYRSDPTAIQEARKILKDWHAPLGVYLVSGSPAVDLAETMPVILEDLPIHWMKQDHVTLELPSGQIDLVGLTCTHRPHVDGQVLQRLLPSAPQNFCILLYHTPDLAPIAARLGVDLQLSGHTHAGQVRIPGFGALVTGSLYGKRFEAGRSAVGNMILYVTRGIGLEGAAAPRLRFFCLPEIILWDIQGQGDSL